MEKILIATKNQGKVKEFTDLVIGIPIEFTSLSAYPNLPDVVEDGNTFEANALKKARFYSRATSLISMADDSGISIDFLGGKPGVYSARYAGENSSDEEKYMKILHELKHVPDSQRQARFICVIALVFAPGKEHIFRAECEGRITHEPRGTGGFGYDPIFYYAPVGKTFGEMDREEKNKVSHRGKALKLVADFLLERSLRLI